jgi:hypothetical protein
MKPRLLVLSEGRGLRDAIDDMLMGRATVTWARTPHDTEGYDIDAVIVDEPQAVDTLNQVRVHPRLHSVPVVMISAEPHDGHADVWHVASTGRHVIDDLAEHLDHLVARALHPSRGRSARVMHHNSAA